MIGRYRFKQNGVTLAESTNVITTEGRQAILRYLAGDLAEWAGAIVIGVGSTPATAGDKRLVFEADRAPIVLRVADLQQETIVFRATFSTGIIGRIYEVGLVTSEFAPADLGSSRILSRFDPGLEEIEGGVVDVNNYRLSDRTLSLTVATGQTGSIVLPAFSQDFSVYQDTDTFALAYQMFDVNVDTITIRFLQDATNYFNYTFTPANASGYYVNEFLRAACTAVGAPSWGLIDRIEFRAAATGGTAVINFDGFRINDTDTNADNLLVSRSVLTTPMSKVIEQELEVEYEVEMNW